MKLLNLNSHNRESLTVEQQIFLGKIVPLSQLIQEWIIGKCQFANKPTRYGLFPSIIISEIILKSEYGTHPLAGEEYNNKYSNNLVLLEANKFWTGKKQKYNDKMFRAYKDWGSFAVDYSDEVVFSGNFDNSLKAYNVTDQIISLTKNHVSCYNGNIDWLISFLNLNEFN